MTNYYTEVALEITMSAEQFDWMKRLHDTNIDRFDTWGDSDTKIQADADIAAAYEAMGALESAGIDTLEYKADQGCAYLTAMECADLDYIPELIHHFLKHFDIAEPVTFEWAATCDKPRPDGFGGGAIIVTKDEIRSMSSNQWIADEIKAMEKPPSPDTIWIANIWHKHGSEYYAFKSEAGARRKIAEYCRENWEMFSISGDCKDLDDDEVTAAYFDEMSGEGCSVDSAKLGD